MRKKIIAGNWKMNYCVNKGEAFVEEIKNTINTDEVDVVICPNFVSLDRISDALEGTSVKLGAQNVYFEDKGAYTGETSVDMLAAVGVSYCIVGHSERRQYFAETDEIVNKKAKKLLEKDICPIVCVGETLEERESNTMFEVVFDDGLNHASDIVNTNITLTANWESNVYTILYNFKDAGSDYFSYIYSGLGKIDTVLGSSYANVSSKKYTNAINIRFDSSEYTNLIELERNGYIYLGQSFLC